MSDAQKWSSGDEVISVARSGFDASALLAVIVEFARAHEVLLFREYNSGLVVQGYAEAGQAKKSGWGPEPDIGCNLAMISVVKDVLQSDKTYHGPSETGDANILCVPVTVQRSEKVALYLRSQGSENVFSDADKRAVELFGITLGTFIDLEFCNSEQQRPVDCDENETALDKTVSIANPGYIDPSDLAEVAKSIAIEINNSLTAIVAHTSAALRWINQGESQIQRAKLSLDRIAAAAFSAGGIISVYKSAGKGERPEAGLVDIRQAVVRALDELEHEFLEFDITSDCALLHEGFVFAEPKQLHQALVNIISAALDSLKGSGTQKKLRILGEHYHHEFVVKISDDARPSARNNHGAGPETANYTSREIKLAIANTLAHVQGGGLALSGFEESEKALKLSLPNTKRQRYLHFM
ncbi:hypothetical protein [Brucella pseudogrignonensis]|uniref:hypothetical protein n=1 Tax=Brucella pseudogrignonensis TaxID=419475 RepID=UPI00124CF109|nr:hypothetical protein [Brucella pseudogrignonensis]KAB2683658.1 hypothetical protein F9K82_23270 [Brucella pseudogrignonensis]